MIVGIGSDIVEYSTNTVLLNWDRNGKFPERILSDEEMTIYRETDHHTFIAGRFAAKEAVLKVLGTGMLDGISLKDISIKTLKSGKPDIQLSGIVKQLAQDLGITNWHITITHSTSFSLAFVIAESL